MKTFDQDMTLQILFFIDASIKALQYGATIEADTSLSAIHATNESSEKASITYKNEVKHGCTLQMVSF